MKILVKNQCLKTGTNKQQRGIKITMPVWGTCAVYKVEQQSVEREMSPLTDGKQNQMSQLQPWAIPNTVQVMQAPEVPNLDRTLKQAS